MGISFGVLCLICFCLLSAKAVTAKLHFKKMDKILMKVHKPVSALLMITCFIHILCVVPLLKNRNALVVISGIANIVFMVLLICLCHVIKDKKKKILWHRIMTILMAMSIIGHCTTYIIDFKIQEIQTEQTTPDEISDETPTDDTLSTDSQSGKKTEIWDDEQPAYVKAYTEFLLQADIDQESGFPIRGYYLFDLNFDDIPELGVLHDSWGSMGGYFTYYYYDGNEIAAILNDRGEPVQISNYTQLLADFKQKKVYLVKEMYLLQGNENGTYGYVKEIKNDEQVPCVYDILNLVVDQGSDLESYLGTQYENEDDFLSDPELEDCLITQRYVEKEWSDISSSEYLNHKRELIPKENSFMNLQDGDLKYLGENFDEDGLPTDVKMSQEEIELLFRHFEESLE